MLENDSILIDHLNHSRLVFCHLGSIPKFLQKSQNKSVVSKVTPFCSFGRNCFHTLFQLFLSNQNLEKWPTRLLFWQLNVLPMLHLGHCLLNYPDSLISRSSCKLFDSFHLTVWRTFFSISKSREKRSSGFLRNYP